MALTDDSNSGIPATMLVGPTGFSGGMPYPVYQGGNNGNGFGGDGWWIILLLLALGGGWGNGYGGFGGNQLGYDFPWILNGQTNLSTQMGSGFRDNQIQDSITSVRDGISALATQLCGCCGDMQMALANSTAGIQQSLCSGFAGTTAAVTGAQNAISQQLYSNEIASLNRSFAEQSANTAGFNGVQSALCDIRYGNATNTREILSALSSGVQSIKDQLCQDKIDAKNDEIAQLRQENLYARGQASQIAQNAAIINGIYDRLNNCPVGTVPVYGEQPIFTCPQSTSSCGCGCNGSF